MTQWGKIYLSYYPTATYTTIPLQASAVSTDFLLPRQEQFIQFPLFLHAICTDMDSIFHIAKKILKDIIVTIMSFNLSPNRNRTRIDVLGPDESVESKSLDLFEKLKTGEVKIADLMVCSNRSNEKTLTRCYRDHSAECLIEPQSMSFHPEKRSTSLQHQMLNSYPRAIQTTSCWNTMSILTTTSILIQRARNMI